MSKLVKKEGEYNPKMVLVLLAILAVIGVVTKVTTLLHPSREGRELSEGRTFNAERTDSLFSEWMETVSGVAVDSLSIDEVNLTDRAGEYTSPLGADLAWAVGSYSRLRDVLGQGSERIRFEGDAVRESVKEMRGRDVSSGADSLRLAVLMEMDGLLSGRLPEGEGSAEDVVSRRLAFFQGELSKETHVDGWLVKAVASFGEGVTAEVIFVVDVLDRVALLEFSPEGGFSKNVQLSK